LSEQSGVTTIEELPDQLVDYALARGGQDNITVIAVEVDAGAEVVAPNRVRSDHLIEVLGSSYLFSSLSLAQLSRVLDRARAHQYQPGEVIRGQGEVMSDLLVVINGTIRVEAADGRSAVVGPGQHLGEDVVLRPRPIGGRVVANEAVTVLSLQGEEIIDLAHRRPWLGVALLSRLVERLSADLDRAGTATHRTSSQVAHLLL
jgi:CRP-like cAMP-binding protein